MAYTTVFYTDPGSGTSVVFDNDGTGELTQAVKLLDATAGSTAATGVSGNPLRTDPTGTTTQPVSIDAGTNNIGDVDVLTMPATAAQGALSRPSVMAVVAGWDGTAIQSIATDENGVLQTNVTNISTITEYQEDTAADADPAGTMPILVRSDALAARTTADGDNIAATATDYGEQRVYGRSIDLSGVLFDGAIEATVKRAAISAASSGDNTIVAAVAAKKIRVVSLFLVASGAVTVRFEDGAAGTALTGQMQFAANGGISLPHNKDGWFEGGTNTLLNLELSAATSVDGALSYVEVD